MNKQHLTLAMLLIALLWPVTIAAQQDKPTLAQAKSAYQHADRDLNKAYQAAKAELDERTFEDLKIKQRSWIRYRDYFCNEVIRRDDPSLAKADLTQEVIYWQRMTSITKERAAILFEIASAQRGEDRPLAGRWIDGFGGTLDIVEHDGQASFTIDVVRGPTHHLGHLAGTAQVNRRLVRFTDGGEDDGKGYSRKPAWVTLIRRTDHLELITSNAHYYCGARAYFDNDYYRIGDLTEEERKRVRQQAAGYQER